MQSINPSLKFINFLKKNTGVNAQDTDFTSALRNVLEIFQATDEYKWIKETKGTAVGVEVADEVPDKSDNTTRNTVKVQKKNMTGITACLSIKEVMETDITGSKIVAVIFEETSRCYFCTSFTDIFAYIITEMLDYGFTVDEIVSCDDDTDFDVLKDTKDGIRVAGECNGIYYERNLSTKDVMKKVFHLLTCLCLDTNTVKVVMCNRQDYKEYADSGLTDEDITKKLYGASVPNLILNDTKVGKQNTQLGKLGTKCNGTEFKDVEDASSQFRKLWGI